MSFVSSPPFRVGIVGTGYAARVRAETFSSDDRAVIAAVSSRNLERSQELARPYAAEALDSWQAIVERDDIDIIVICTTNDRHGAIARAAVEGGKHVVVEYPLALDPAEAAAIVDLADSNGTLLHVEHIELLGGLHRTLRQYLPEVGTPFYARYVTANPKHPAPRSWTYQHETFGFPLVAALSRLNRFVDCFGTVKEVSARSRFWERPQENYYAACWCAAQLEFTNGVVADIIYSKGETIWQSENRFQVWGDRGKLVLEPAGGLLVLENQVQPIDIEPRKGLFAKDTAAILDRLTDGTSLYTTPAASLYTLKVAEATRIAAETGKPIAIDDRA